MFKSNKELKEHLPDKNKVGILINYDPVTGEWEYYIQNINNITTKVALNLLLQVAQSLRDNKKELNKLQKEQDKSTLN